MTLVLRVHVSSNGPSTLLQPPVISAVLQAAGKEAVNEGAGKPKAVSALFQLLLLGVVAPLGYLYLSVSCGQLLGHVLFQQTLESRYSMSNMAP